MVAVELSREMFEVAAREAAAAGRDIASWVEEAIAFRSRGELPYDDCGFPVTKSDGAFVGSSHSVDHAD